MPKEVTKVWKEVEDLYERYIENWEPKYTEVLDHGFIGLVDFMGDDSAIVNAARVSYGTGTKATRSDEGLIRYLMRHWHTTPFEMVEFKFHVKAPIFVFRQWHRHRTASINEMSGRYSILDNEMYLPYHDHTAAQSNDNKQGRAGLLSQEDYKAVLTALDHGYETSYSIYQYLYGPDKDGHQAKAPDALELRRKTIEDGAMASLYQLRQEQSWKPEDERQVIDESFAENVVREWFNANDIHIITDQFPGIARELARMILPVATYSQMYWKANLHNIMHFLRLRADNHAQYEIRVYAEAMMNLITPYVPMAMQAFKDYQLNANSLSAMESNLIRWARTGHLDITNNDEIEKYLIEQGCSSREIREFIEKF